RGFQTPRIRDNIEQMIRLCQGANAKILLLGMKIPPNYGLRYTSDFYNIYSEAAKQFDIPLVPFFLDGVAGRPEMMLDDGIHPRAEAQEELLKNVLPHLKPLL